MQFFTITFDKRGGGERLVINLARALKADIYTGYIDRKKTFDTKGVRIVELGVNKRLPNGLKQIAIAKKFEGSMIKKYDCYIFSGVWCISASARYRPNVFYCHTPPRYMYDLKDHFMKNSGVVSRIALRRLIKYWKPRDRKYMQFFDVVCPNSNNVKKRIRKYYGEHAYKKSYPVYTGIDTRRFYTGKSENFYLATQRLDKLKRLDMIIRAFARTGRRLVITGTGPEEKRLKQLAKNRKNIEFVGNVSEERLLDLYSKCRAVVSAPVNEDLGLTAIEGQAAGKPVLAVREGGLLETVVDGKTGVFFEPNDASLMAAIKEIEKKKWDARRIKNNAKKYDVAAFKKTMEKMIKLSVSKRKQENEQQENGGKKRQLHERKR